MGITKNMIKDGNGRLVEVIDSTARYAVQQLLRKAGSGNITIVKDYSTTVNSGGGGGGGELTPATKDKLGGVIVGDNLSVTRSGVLSVDTATDISADNTKPATAAQVYTQLGNIAALLRTI